MFRVVGAIIFSGRFTSAIFFATSLHPRLLAHFDDRLAGVRDFGPTGMGGLALFADADRINLDAQRPRRVAAMSGWILPELFCPSRHQGSRSCFSISDRAGG